MTNTTLRKDPIVENVCEKFQERSRVGIKKYGHTLDRTDLSLLEWVNHAQEEAMDFVLYLQRIQEEIKTRFDKEKAS